MCFLRQAALQFILTMMILALIANRVKRFQ
jgi:hypothetical protein